MMRVLRALVEPGLTYRFYLEIGGLAVAEFTELEGISAEREVKTYEEGGINDRVLMFPGRMKYANIVLKKGITWSPLLWVWFQEGLYTGKVKRLNLSIILGNPFGMRLKQWDVINAFPIKYRNSDLKAEANEIAIETLELAHEGISLGLLPKSPV